VRHYLLPAWGHSRYVSSAYDLCLAPNKWWDQEPFNYPHALISYVHWRKPFQFPEGAHIFGDSGGFSLRAGSRSRKLDAIDVLHWQATLCTVGCILDLPPRGMDWAQALRVTVAHTVQALPKYRQLRADRSPFRWWGVLHGNNETQVREYHDAITAVYPFSGDGEGWAIRAGPQVNIYSVARSLRVLKQLRITRAHFLAATDQKVIAVMLALGPIAGLELLTYDSTYAMKTGSNRLAFIPREDGLKFRLLKEVDAERKARDFLLHECPCRVCAYMRERSARVWKAQRELTARKFGGWWSGWFQQHNLHIQQKLTAAQADAAQSDPDALLRAMLSEREYAVVMRVFHESGHEPRSAQSERLALV
jgi:hypothetical protein